MEGSFQDVIDSAHRRMSSANIQDEESIEAGEARPSIPEGVYHVQCIDVERKYYYNFPKIILKCRIIPPSKYKGTDLNRYFNAYKKVPPGSDYYEEWVIANNNVKPTRRDNMTPKIFIGGFFEVVVRNTKRKFKDGTEKPDSLNYSVIAFIKRKIS